MPVPEPVIEPEVAEEIAPAEAEMHFEEEAPAEELGLDQPMAEDEGDELLLGSGDMLAGEGPAEAAEDIPSEEPMAGNRSWLTGPDDAPSAPRVAGTPFQRMPHTAPRPAHAHAQEQAPAHHTTPKTAPKGQ